VTGSRGAVRPLDGSGLGFSASVPTSNGVTPKVTTRSTNGISVTETERGSEYPPKAQVAPTVAVTTAKASETQRSRVGSSE
jgi:hypothetical protein